MSDTLRGAIYGIAAAAIWGGMYVVSDVVLVTEGNRLGRRYGHIRNKGSRVDFVRGPYSSAHCHKSRYNADLR